MKDKDKAIVTTILAVIASILAAKGVVFELALQVKEARWYYAASLLFSVPSCILSYIYGWNWRNVLLKHIERMASLG